MRESTAVKDAMLRFYDRLSASDVASFDTSCPHTRPPLSSGPLPVNG
jgi:hypothetical protein